MLSKKIIALCATGLLTIAIPVASSAASANQKQVKKQSIIKQSTKQVLPSKQVAQSRSHKPLHSIKPAARHVVSHKTSSKQLRTHSSKASKLSTRTRVSSSKSRTLSKTTHKQTPLSVSHKRPTQLSASHKRPAQLSTSHKRPAQLSKVQRTRSM